MMLVIGMVVAIILLINENNELKKEINRLKMLLASKGVKENKPLNKQVNKSFFCPVCGEANTEENSGVCKNCLHVLGQDEINVLKKDEESSKPIKGVKYELKLNGSILQTLETDSNGEITFNNLYPGSYELQEIATNDNYILEIVYIDNPQA